MEMGIMFNDRVDRAEQLGLVKKPYSAGLGITGLVSMGISGFSGFLLAYDFLGYHAPGRAPHPALSGLILVLELSLAAFGQVLGAGRNEGIRTRGWLGVIDVLLIRLALAGTIFIGSVVKYAMHGKQIHQIHLYP
jgi:hypothetical protein